MQYEDEIPNLLYKICIGEADEEEKKKWDNFMGMDFDSNDLKETCQSGYQMAEKMDNNSMLQQILSSIDKLRNDIEKLNTKVDILLKEKD